ncbi:DNA-binding transcriptional LysR family regulator [Allocatelliglobosispora scoriae]|uniref:DNA-binding transcriptional LysR family regulator n=1 Tax=Allocatelliglobosispora scoriae TaxID=643052 RepID=A0A841C5I8_9ACTN|nr:LysR substrate-binding domain-containing protein [Allocatelliglobosispora scoriae]MBB5874393.1 DNA-binding transcriptional LysR family regulator [Allocatelliglobosispora scoriae]
MNPGDGIDLRLLRYFLTVAEELHFTRAAARLYISQPALSNQIQRLERELGTALFARTTRGVNLTSAGAAFLPYAQQTVTALLTGIAAANADTVVRVDVLDAELRTPRVVLSFLRTAHPDLRVLVTAQGSASQRRRILAADLDAGFCGLGAVADDALAGEVIHREPVDVVLPATHPLAGAEQVGLAALAEDVFYLPHDAVAPEWNDFVRAACRDAGFQPRRHPTATDGAATALDLVREGACVTLGLRSTPHPEGTVRRPLAGAGLAYPWALMWHRQHGDRPAITLVRDAARAAATAHGWATR